MTNHKIDVHHHLVPPFWVEDLQQHPTVQRVPQWSPSGDLESRDRQGIEKALLSLSVPGVAPWPPAERGAAARKVNAYTVDLVARCPGRFGSIAPLPPPDIVAAPLHIAYAFATLSAACLIVSPHFGVNL